MKKIMVLGGRAAGKTMFIAGLAEYCRASRGGRLKLVPLDDPSRAYMSRVQESVRAGAWPSATSDVHLVSFRLLTEDQRELVLEVVDYPGEVVERLHGGQDLGPWRKVLESLPAVDKVLLLLSIDQDLPEGDDPDRSGQLERQDAAADLLQRLLAMKQSAGGTQPPERAHDGQDIPNHGDLKPENVLVKPSGGAAREKLDVIPVVTKSDLIEGLTGPEANEEARARVDRRAHLLLKNLDESPGLRVRETQFVTAVGHVIRESEGSPAKPPAGAMEPSGFADLVEEMHKADEERRDTVRRNKLALCALFATVLGLAWFGLERHKKRSIEEAAATGSTETVHALTSEKLSASSDEGMKVRRRLSSELDGLESRLASAPPRSVLDAGLEELDALMGNPNNPEVGRTRSLREAYVARIEGGMVDELEGSSTYQQFLQSLSAYEERFGTDGSRASEVRELLDRRRTAEVGRLRRAATQIDASSKARIRQRLERSLKFLEIFPEDARAEELQRANRVAEALLDATSIQVSVHRIDLEEADGGDRVRVEFHRDASLSSESRIGESKSTKKGPETTWVEADGASYPMDLGSRLNRIFVAVNDPGDGVLNGAEEWGAVPVEPLRDFILDGGSFKLTREGSLILTRALETGVLGPLQTALVEEFAGSEEAIEAVGSIKLRFSVRSQGATTSFTEEDRLAYLRFYLSAAGWRLDG